MNSKNLQALNDALEAGNKPVTEFTAPPLKITQTKTLIMEYVALPVIDLSYRFLYRFLEPFPTIWQEGVLTTFHLPIADGMAAHVKEYGLKQYYKLVTADMSAPLPSEAQWLMEVDLCTLVECEITPKR